MAQLTPEQRRLVLAKKPRVPVEKLFDGQQRKDPWR
jgi:hypothetical protein